MWSQKSHMRSYRNQSTYYAWQFAVVCGVQVSLDHIFLKISLIISIDKFSNCQWRHLFHYVNRFFPALHGLDVNNVRLDLLHQTFDGRLIRRNGVVNWSPRSKDLTQLNYFLWSAVNIKNSVMPTNWRQLIIWRSTIVMPLARCKISSRFCFIAFSNLNF